MRVSRALLARFLGRQCQDNEWKRQRRDIVVEKLLQWEGETRIRIRPLDFASVLFVRVSTEEQENI